MNQTYLNPGRCNFVDSGQVFQDLDLKKKYVRLWSVHNPKKTRIMPGGKSMVRITGDSGQA